MYLLIKLLRQKWNTKGDGNTLLIPAVLCSTSRGSGSFSWADDCPGSLWSLPAAFLNIFLCYLVPNSNWPCTLFWHCYQPLKMPRRAELVSESANGGLRMNNFNRSTLPKLQDTRIFQAHPQSYWGRFSNGAEFNQDHEPCGCGSEDGCCPPSILELWLWPYSNFTAFISSPLFPAAGDKCCVYSAGYNKIQPGKILSPQDPASKQSKWF